MTLELMASLYILMAFALLNTAWAVAPSWTLCARTYDTALRRFSEWLWRFAVVFYGGYLIDQYLSNAPHQFYSEWTLWTTFTVTAVAFTTPGFLIWRHKKGA